MTSAQVPLQPTGRPCWSNLPSLWARLTWGHFRRHWLEALLCLFGVALGVAVVVGVDAAVDACVRSFSGAVGTLAEQSTHSIFSDGGTISDEQFNALLRKKLPIPLAPVIDRNILAAAGSTPPELARLIGIDAFAERQLRTFTQMQDRLDETALSRFLTEPNTVVLVDQLAEKLHVQTGDTLGLTVGGRRHKVTVVGIVRPAVVARAQLKDVVVADIATAQELTGDLGRIDRVDTRIESPQQQVQLESALPDGLILRSTSQQGDTLAQLISSYRLNLNALSLMASFVAVFIVYNSMLISVQQRAKSLGILRSLGATRPQLAGIYVVEAVIFAVLGGAIGVMGGWLLSRSMVGMVSTTINDLYAAIDPGPVTLGWAAAGKGLAVSAVSCLLGTAVPLLRAAWTPPVNAFRPTQQLNQSHVISLRLLAVGAALLSLSYGIFLLPTNSPIIGFFMAMFIALGFAMLCPVTMRIVSGGVGEIARRAQWLPLQMAASGTTRALGITGVAVAATMLAMSMNIGIRTMVGSFRGSLETWMEQRFSADVFIAPEMLVKHKADAWLDRAVGKWVSAQPETARVIEYRGRETPVGGKSTLISATDLADTLRTLPMKLGPVAGAFDPAADVLISEPLAGRTSLKPGQTFVMATPSGNATLRVYGVFFDFGNERGQIIIDLPTYQRLWQDSTINSLHVTLRKGASPENTAARWNAALRENYPVAVNSFSGVKAEAMQIFDRTFKVTEVLTWLGGGVAFCGMAGALLALAMARQRDFAVLATVGMSTRQMLAWVLGQGLLLAWTAAGIACVSGTALAFVLAGVIQYRSFGWSIPTHFHPLICLQNIAMATLAAAVAAIYPVWRLRVSPPAGALRQE